MEVSITRKASVAGLFYPQDARVLSQEIQALLSDRGKHAVHGLIVPHSTLQRSGRVAASVYSAVRIPRRVIIVGPTLTGAWMPWSILTRGAFRTPLGSVAIDVDLAESIAGQSPFLEKDDWGQEGEHAIEVQLPFLQVCAEGAFSCVPILAGSPDSEQHARLGGALASAVKAAGEPVLLIASSNLSQFEADADVRSHDRCLLDHLKEWNFEGFMRAIKQYNISIPGYAAIQVVLSALKSLQCSQISELSYATSAESGGDPNSSEGYVGMVVSNESFG